MPHRQLVGTFHPCGTIARYTGRDHDFKKSLHLSAWDSPLWPRGVVATSLLGKALHSNFILPTASYQKIQDIAKPGRSDPAPESPKAVPVESVAMGSGPAIRGGTGSATGSHSVSNMGTGKMGFNSSKRSGSGDLAKLLHAQMPVEKEVERARGVKLADSATAWIGCPAPTIDRPLPIPRCEPIHPTPHFPPAAATTPGKVCTSNGNAAALPKPIVNMEHHGPPKKAPRPPAKKMPVRVSMTLSMTGSTSNAFDKDDSVLLMVPQTTLGERVIELALAADEFDGPENVEHEDPSHFDLLRLKKISGDKFRIGSLFDRRKPVGDAGTGYFALCKTTD